MASASIVPFHGVRVFQSGEEPIVVSFRDTSVIGMLAAVDPDDLTNTGFALNTPALITRPSEAVNLPAAVKEDLDSIFDQVYTNIVLVLIDEGDDAADTITNAVGDATAKTGIHAFLKATAMGLPRPKLLIAPGLTVTTATDGVASITVGTAGSGYDPDLITVTVAGDSGQGAVLRPILGLGGEITAIVVDKPGYGYTGTLTVTINANGAGSGGAATGTIGTVLNAVVAEAQGVAEKLRAVFYTDGPDSTDANAVVARGLIGSQRVVFCDPRVLKSVNGSPTPKYASPIFAGQQAWFDRNRNVAWAATNRVVNGIQGTNRPVEYESNATYLNENGINTIINNGYGFITWGPKTCAPNSSIWKFVSVVRVADLVNESIEEAFRAYVGRPQLRAQLDLMVIDGREALRGLENDGVLLPGSNFWMKEYNADDGPQGIVKFGMKYEPPAPIYDVRIEAYRNPTIAYELLFDSVTGQVAIGGDINV